MKRPKEAFGAHLAAALAALTLTGCQGLGQGADAMDQPANPASAEAGGGETAGAKKKGKTDAELKKELDEAKEAKVKARRESRYAETDLTLAELAVREAELDATESLRKARTDLEAAKEKMTRYESLEKPIAEQDAALDVAQAENRVATAETDLAGIMEIMSQEVEASSKDEIIRRHQTQVQFAQQRLVIAQARHGLATDVEAQATLRELAGKVRAAEAALAKAEIGAEKKRRKAELDLQKKTDAADDAKRKAKAADKKVEALQKTVNKRNRAKNEAARKKEAAEKEAADKDAAAKDTAPAKDQPKDRR